MQRKVICILTSIWLAAFIIMAAGWIPRSQLYYFPLNVYGWLVCQVAPYKIEPSPPASLSPPLEENSPITVVTPWSHIVFSSLLNAVPQENRTLVVCSALDNYIVSHYSQTSDWSRTRRIVVFDGGHHLATLVTAPDIVLVPVTKGYAAHTLTRDAISVREIKAIIRELNAPTRLVTAPRWAVVKCEWGLYGWASRLTPYIAEKPAKTQIISGSHYAIGQRLALAYIEDKSEARKLQKLLTNNRGSYDKLMLAFNFDSFTAEEASIIAREWSKSLDKSVNIVNKPATVFSLY